MWQQILHYSLHFVLPFIIAIIFYKQNWIKAGLLLLSNMLIDVDHLLATPVFQLHRCSINFHPLHSWYILPVYIGLLFIKGPVRLIAIGLCLHILTDTIDCYLTWRNCGSCIGNTSMDWLFNL